MSGETFKKLHAELESKYRKIVENTLQGIIIAQGSPARIVFANSAMGKLFGYSSEELVALSPQDTLKLAHPDDRETFFGRFGQRLAGKKVESVYEVRGIRKDGKTIWLEACGTLIEHNGQPSVQGVFLDITERKKAEQDLKESEEKYKALFEQAGDYNLILEVPSKGAPVIFDANSSALQIHGYTREEIIGKPIMFLDTESGDERMFEGLRRLLNNEKLMFEARHRRKDGSTIDVEVSIKKVQVGSKNFLVSVERDITERKKAEQSVLESEAKFKELVNLLPEMVFEIDINAHIVFANARAFELTGYSKEDFGKVFDANCLVAPEDRSRSKENMKIMFDGNMRQSNEYTFVRKDGTRFPVCLSSVPIVRDGKIVGARGVVVDITESKKVERELKMFSLAIQKTKDGVVIGGPNGFITYVNDALLEMCGVANKKDIIGKHVLEFVAERDRSRVTQSSLECLKTGQSYLGEFTGLRNDGSEFQIEVATALITDEKGQGIGFVDIIRNISERKKTEEALRESKEKNQFYLENAPLAFFVCKPDGKADFVNKAACDLLDYSQEELLRTSFADVLLKEDLPKALKLFSAFKDKDKGVSIREFRLKRKNGQTVNVFLSCARLPGGKLITFCQDITELKKAEEESSRNKAYLESILNTVLSGIIIVNGKTHEIVDVNSHALTLLGASKEQVVGEVCHKFVCPAEKGKCPATDLGQDIMNSELTLLALNGNRIPIIKSVSRLKEGDTTYLIENFVDISDRKNAETKIEESSRKIKDMNEKLRVVGSLTRHDVRNKLSTVNGYAYLLRRKHLDQADIVEGMDKIEKAVKDSVRIFEFAKMYEQLGVEELTFVDVDKVVDEAVALFSGLTLKVVNDCQGLYVRADSFLRQMFYNFIDNTRKYGEKATAIKVHCETAESGELRLSVRG